MRATIRHRSAGGNAMRAAQWGKNTA
jgi:hypothetical protein